MNEQIRDVRIQDLTNSELQELIDSKNEQIDNLEDSKMTEPTEEMIEEKVQEFVDDAVSDPYDYLRNHLGLDSRSMFNYVDKESMAEELSSSEGLGSMNPYNNDYDTFEFNGEEYVVMQTNG